MRDNKVGFSRLGRAVAVIGMSLGLMVVTTVPSQAVTATLTPLLASALPSTVIPASTIGITGVTGTAVGATICAATIYCGLAVVAGIAIVVGGAGLIWTHKGIPNADIVGEGSVQWVTYPYKNPNGPFVIASYKFGDKPAALKEYPGTDNVQHCVVVVNKQIPSNKQLTNCNGAGTFVPDAVRPGGTEEYEVVYSDANYDPIGFAVRLWVGGSVTSKVWEIAIIDKIAGGAIAIPQTLEPNPVTIPAVANPDRRVKVTTRCTRNDGTHYYVTKYTSTYKQTDAQRPNIVADLCTQPTDTPTGIEADEEKKDPNTEVWTPSPLTPGTEDPSKIIDTILPEAVTQPNYTFQACISGVTTCNIEIGKIQPDGSVESCTTADCSDIEQWVKPDAPTINNPYRCTYGGTVVSPSECTPAVPDIVATPTTTPTTSCGITDIQCWLNKIFLPNPQTVETVFAEIQATWDRSVIGRLPTIMGGLAAPFTTPGLFVPTAGNCNGPTITLPQNMGITSVGVDGNYVIQPLKACDGLAKTVSETWRTIATPTVFITGGIAVINTLLGAVGLSLRGIRNGE